LRTILVLEVEEQQIRTLHQIYQVFRLDNFGVWVWKSYSKVLWSWGHVLWF